MFDNNVREIPLHKQENVIQSFTGISPPSPEAVERRRLAVEEIAQKYAGVLTTRIHVNHPPKGKPDGDN
jgi:hypothetical protein